MDPARNEQRAALEIHRSQCASDEDGREQKQWRDLTERPRHDAGGKQRAASELEQHECRAPARRTQGAESGAADDHLEDLTSGRGTA